MLDLLFDLRISMTCSIKSNSFGTVSVVLRSGKDMKKNGEGLSAALRRTAKKIAITGMKACSKT